MSVSMLQIKKMLPKPTKSRMSEKYKDGLRQSWGASTYNEETIHGVHLSANESRPTRENWLDFLSTGILKI